MMISRRYRGWKIKTRKTRWEKNSHGFALKISHQFHTHTHNLNNSSENKLWKNTHKKKTRNKLKEQPRKNTVRIRYSAHIN